MSKILFIMFQGGGTNLKSWNEYTKSKFLDRLKKIGSDLNPAIICNCYTYQNKIYNISHYDKSNSEHKNYDSDLNFDLNYVRVDKHIKMVYDDICKKYDIDNYKLIPIGWSAGSYLALYFAQIYKSKCLHVILLDPVLCTPKNMKLRLENLNSSGINNKPVSNAKFKQMLKNWKNNHTDIEDMDKINDVCHHIISTFISKHLNLKLSIPTTYFVNIESPEGKEWPDFTNECKLNEVKILKKKNPKIFNAVMMTNKTHMIFDKIQPAKMIINYIKNIIKNAKSCRGL